VLRLRRHCCRWVVRSQFYRFLRLHCCKSLPGGRSRRLFEGDRPPFWSCSEENHRVGPKRKIPVRNSHFWHFRNDFAWGPLGGKFFVSRELPVLALSPFFSVSVFLCLVFTMGSIASRWNCLYLLIAPEITVRTPTVGWCLSSTLTTCRELIKSAGKLWWSSPSCTCYCCQWSWKGSVFGDSCCNGFGGCPGTQVWNMYLDFSVGHVSRTT